MFPVIKIAHTTLPEQYSPIVFNQFYETFPEGFLVAEEHHKIIGFIAGLKLAAGTAKILMLAISEKQRRHGIGSALLTEFVQAVIRQKIHQVELEVRTHNIPAIKFYKKQGFAITDTIPGFYQIKEDAYVMRRRV